MKLEFYAEMSRPVAIDAVRLVVRDRQGNPVVLAVEVDGVVIAETPETPGYAELARVMGLEKTVILPAPRQTPAADIDFGRS